METTNDKPKPPVINCHTHVFTGDHVPPYLAKTFLPWPLYYLLSVSLVVKIFRTWYRGPYRWQFTNRYRKIRHVIYTCKMALTRSRILNVLFFLVGTLITIQVFFIATEWLSSISQPATSIKNIESLKAWLDNYGLIFIPESGFGRLALVFILLVFFKPGRNAIWFLIKKLWAFFRILPGPDTKALAQRYINIGRFAFYRQQARILGKLMNQYPAGTGLVVLPMDMEYMDAGKLKKETSYHKQMAELAQIKKKDKYKDLFFPFVFADPRRIAEEGKNQLDFEVENGKVILKDCFIKTYIEENKFNGFKIYPALGYYPFDENLLALWKYAADEGLPIMTHCIKGTIYYRGTKKKEWDFHPVIEQPNGQGYEPMFLSEIKNKEFSNNFGNPLNFLCLLEEKLLRTVVGKAKDGRMRELFGYTDDKTPLTQNLKHLKICFGHYGGDDEWNKFMESDRSNYSSQLIKYPERGISFLSNENLKPTRGKLEQLWKHTDWYSISSSMMLQFPNVYADLSYIIHNPEIIPLLKQTLQNPGLRKRVLFGTDFYVVRNHKTEKSMLAEITSCLSESELDYIARVNPREFLSSKIHGPVKI